MTAVRKFHFAFCLMAMIDEALEVGKIWYGAISQECRCPNTLCMKHVNMSAMRIFHVICEKFNVDRISSYVIGLCKR
jgi:hypothetical protein